jgi:hypothetical protein
VDETEGAISRLFRTSFFRSGVWRQLSSETLHRVRVRLALRLEAFGEVAQGEHLAGGAGEVADQLVRHVGQRLLDESVA